MANLKRGDVFLIDLGLAAKIRPCLIVSIPGADTQRNMSVVAPLTTQPRGGECEIKFPKPPWLHDDSVVHLMGLGGIDNAKVGRFLGRLKPETMNAVSEGLVRMLGL